MILLITFHSSLQAVNICSPDISSLQAVNISSLQAVDHPYVLGSRIDRISNWIFQMLESNINQGKQDLSYVGKCKLKKGVSITDSCINIETINKIILDAYHLLI